MSKKFEADKADNLLEANRATASIVPSTDESGTNIKNRRFAVKAVEHAQTYWNLLEAIPPSRLKLTRLDDEIYDHLSREFPELFENPDKIKVLNEDTMKDKEGKERWRKFISEYEKRVDDYNFGSLIRTDASGEYSQNNAMFVTRMQFYAVEIARNRLGFNDGIHEKAQAEKEKAKNATATPAS